MNAKMCILKLLFFKIKTKLDEFLPLKILKVSSDDRPWVTQEVKDLDRRVKREFYKIQKSINGRDC